MKKKLAAFSEVKLVITDRLHGMLFSAITHTPCIAIDNLSRKVSGVYEWIKALPYVKIIHASATVTITDINDAMMLCDTANEEVFMQLQEEFDPLKEVIKNCLEKR